MISKNLKHRFIKPGQNLSYLELKKLQENHSEGKLTFGKQTTLKKDFLETDEIIEKKIFQTPEGREKSLNISFLEREIQMQKKKEKEIKKGNQTKRLQQQNSILHLKNMKLLKQIKGLSRQQLNDSDGNMRTDRKEYSRNKMVTQRKKKSQFEFQERNTRQKILRKQFSSRQYDSPNSQNQSNDNSHNSQISYLLLCIQQRQDIITNLRSQVNSFKDKQAESLKTQHYYFKQLQQKQQIIKALSKQLNKSKQNTPHTPPTTNKHNNLFDQRQQSSDQQNEVKKQNYSLRLRLNQLTDELVECKQQKREMESIICQLYFDNKFKTQESQLIKEVKISCQKARKEFKKIIKDNQRSH